ncbi:MAG: helix-turn-helix domain-containing protein [Bacteroidales bacterium]|nr:helix-turn-helix domain-containing protein [Bacteroidales bacterium]
MSKKTHISTDENSTYLTELVIEKLNQHGLDIKQLVRLVRSLVPSAEPERFYTMQETLEILKMSRSTLNNIRKNGDIHYREYKGRIWFSKSDIEEFQLKIRK